MILIKSTTYSRGKHTTPFPLKLLEAISLGRCKNLDFYFIWTLIKWVRTVFEDLGERRRKRKFGGGPVADWEGRAKRELKLTLSLGEGESINFDARYNCVFSWNVCLICQEYSSVWWQNTFYMHVIWVLERDRILRCSPLSISGFKCGKKGQQAAHPLLYSNLIINHKNSKRNPSY